MYMGENELVIITGGSGGGGDIFEPSHNAGEKNRMPGVGQCKGVFAF